VDFIHASGKSYISIATYDSKSIHFFAIDNNKEVKAFIVSDIQNPFCPVPRSKLFLHVEEQKELVSKLIEKVNLFITERQMKINANRKNIQGSVTGAAIVAGANALEDNGGRVLVFTCNTCVNGFGACRPREEIKQTTTPNNDKSVYLPQHTQFNSLIEYFTQKRIVIDQFILANYQFDLATFSVLSNQTGGAINFYPINTKDNSDVKFKFEKVHYDLSRILTRPNYYDVKFMLRISMGIETIEILGSFGKKLGEAFQMAGFDPDSSFFYHLRLSENLKNNQRCHFQIVCLYIDNFNQRYLRILNYTVMATTEISKIYSSTDVDSLSKLTILREISLSQHSDVISTRENIVNRIVNSFLFYRQNCSRSTPSAQLILPASVKYFPLYMNAFIKKFISRRNKQGIPANIIIDIINKLMRDPLYHTIKYLYPKFYRVDDIQLDQSNKFTGLDNEYIIKDVGNQNEKYDFITKPYLLPNSLDHIDFDCAYLSDDSDFLTFYVFNYLDPQFYQELFGVNSWEEAVNLGVDTLDESNTNDLNLRLLNIVNQLRKDNKGKVQPIRVLFLE
jgi:protein transport protein SEC24